jgi:hypothetical protein
VHERPSPDAQFGQAFIGDHKKLVAARHFLIFY